MDHAKVEKITGIKIKIEKQIDILSKLGFTVENKNRSLTVHVPSWRPDVSGEIDLVEEVIRVTSLNKLNSTPLPRNDFGVSVNKINKRQRNISKIRRFMASNGLKETINYSFIDKELSLIHI